jgi:hypothetical protein
MRSAGDVVDASPETPGRSRDRSGLALTGLILSAATFFIAPGLVTVGFYMPIFTMMSPVSGASSNPAGTGSFPSFGAWALLPILLPLPGLLLSLFVLLRPAGSEKQKGMAIARVAAGALALIFVGSFSLYLYA